MPAADLTFVLGAALLRIRDGHDPAAWDALVTHAAPRLRGMLRRRLDDPVLIDDALQETWLAVRQSVQRFDPAIASDERIAWAWLGRLAQRRAIALLRSERRHRRVRDDDLTHIPAPDIASTPRRRWGSGLYAACAELTPRQRQLIAWRHGEGLPIREIADRTGSQANAVSQALHRAYGSLRRRLTDGPAAGGPAV
jgi:RNA polymerase sigma-70 factor (ECF subfamily)